MTVAALVAGCSTTSADRQAAGSAGSQLSPSVNPTICEGECVWDVTAGGTDRLIAENGATVIFAHNNAPVASADIGVLCWSAGDDVEAGSCTEDGKQPPAELGITATTVTRNGVQWPALLVRSVPVDDGTSEPVLALPATVLMAVDTGDEGILPLTVEIACCNRIS
ncbi:MAG: hypothetical protein ACKN9D_12025 [Actinomycetales bacterium]